MIPLLKKFPVKRIVMQIDQKRGSFKIRTDEIIPVNGAIQEFLFCKFFVNSWRRKGGDILKQLFYRFGRTFQQWDIQDC